MLFLLPAIPAIGAFILGKKVTGRDPLLNKDNAVDDYVRNRMLSPLSFSGDYGDLQARLSSETDSCATYVKSKGVLVTGAREACSNKIQLAYSDVISNRQAESYNNDQKAIEQLFQSNTTIFLIIGIAVVLIIIILFF